jgi:asparaginyl-tRNA synthetase
VQKADISKLLKTGSVNDNCIVAGWVRTKRDGKGFSFLELNDGSCLANIQIVADDSLTNYAEIKSLTTGSSLRVEGELVESPAKGQKVELHASSVEIYSIAPSDNPLQKKRHSFEYLRDIAHLRPRTNAIGAVMRVRSKLAFAVNKFFVERDFKLVHTPIITASDCEGAGEMFRVTTLNPNNTPKTEEGEVDWSKDFFGSEAHLTVSGQLEGEIMATALGKIYTFGPTFRAEKSHTPRHLAEFWMIEPEVAFNTIIENMELAEDFVRYLATYILKECREDLEFFNLRIDNTVISVLENIANSSFERVSYTETISILEKVNSQFEYPVEWGSDLQTEHERYLTETKFQKPVIVYNYPKSIKPFYMKQNDDGKTVAAMDLLVPRIGELIGGSEREWRLDLLEQRIDEMGLNRDDYWWYLDLRKYGSVPHSGFGLGFERMVLLATGMKNIREVIPFPRFPGSAKF